MGGAADGSGTQSKRSEHDGWGVGVLYRYVRGPDFLPIKTCGKQMVEILQHKPRESGEISPIPTQR